MSKYINILKEAELQLYILLHPDNRHKWKSLDIVYEEPHVERLWINIDENLKFCIHLIHRTDQKPLYHPHDWFSAVKIISNKYKMEIGTENQILSTIVLEENSYYEMTAFNAYHSVNPVYNTSLSLMIMGNKYNDPIKFPKPKEKQKELSEKAKNYLFLKVMQIYKIQY